MWGEGWDLGDVVRLSLAVILGGILGLPSRHRPGGLRTHSLVCGGATLFTLAAVHVAGSDGAGLVRVIQGVASGIGFVGAAAVLKRGGRVHGVSVAASIWIAGAIGCELGMGSIGFALLAMILVTMVNLLYDLLERRYIPGYRREIPRSPPPGQTP